MRIRRIRPEFFLDEQVAALEPLARLFLIGLWCAADREGRLEDSPRRLKMMILPYDEVDPEELLDALARSGLIVRYTADDQRCIYIVGFAAQQRPRSRGPASRLPAPPSPGSSQAQARLKPGSGQARARLRPGSSQDRARLRPGSSQAQARIEPGSSQAQAWIEPGSSQAQARIEPGSSQDQAWPEQKPSENRPQIDQSADVDRALAAKNDARAPDRTSEHDPDPDLDRTSDLDLDLDHRSRGTEYCDETEFTISVNADKQTRDPVLLEFPVEGSVAPWQLRASMVAELRRFFPSLDVEQECRHALAWILASPDRRKTVRGMRRFLTNWLTRAVERRGRLISRSPPSRSQETLAALQAAGLVREED